AGRDVVMEGEIIDPQCWFTHGGEGLAHRACAQMCARGGQDLAFLNRSGGRVYPIIAPGHGANPNDSLVDVVGYPVVIEARLFVRHGQRAIMVRRVKRLDAAASDSDSRAVSTAVRDSGSVR